jgi:hypothetical protein
MSKTDAMKAMKQARAAERAQVRPAPRAAKPAARAEPAAQTTPTEPATGQVCGHRAISGKSCIREKGHAQVDHRYAKTPVRA